MVPLPAKKPFPSGRRSCSSGARTWRKRSARLRCRFTTVHPRWRPPSRHRPRRGRAAPPGTPLAALQTSAAAAVVKKIHPVKPLVVVQRRRPHPMLVRPQR
uniref:(northern house mosquito) hypothetical protein n=1 Tax=Culex pipiens TaxID=7175 RepID=A0A8D7ZYE9_CULPI